MVDLLVTAVPMDLIYCRPNDSFCTGSGGMAFCPEMLLVIELYLLISLITYG